MARTPDLHITIIPSLFRDELDSLGISIASFDDPESLNYIGICSRTIRRGIVNGYFSRNTIEALSDIMDVDRFVIDMDYKQIEDLEKERYKLLSENARLKKENDKLHAENHELKKTLKFIQKVIKKKSVLLNES